MRDELESRAAAVQAAGRRVQDLRNSVHRVETRLEDAKRGLLQQASRVRSLQNEKDDLTARIAETAARIRQLPEVAFTLVTVADDPAQTQNQGSVFVRLKDLGERERDQFSVMNEVRSSILPSIAGDDLRTGVRPVATFGGGGNQNAEIQFTINGPDLDALERFGNAVAEAARQQPGLVDVDTSLNVGKPELSVYIDRMKAADLGVQTADAAEALRLLVGGDQPAFGIDAAGACGPSSTLTPRAKDRNRNRQPGARRGLTASYLRTISMPWSRVMMPPRMSLQA